MVSYIREEYRLKRFLKTGPEAKYWTQEGCDEGGRFFAQYSQSDYI